MLAANFRDIPDELSRRLDRGAEQHVKFRGVRTHPKLQNKISEALDFEQERAARRGRSRVSGQNPVVERPRAFVANRMVESGGSKQGLEFPFDSPYRRGKNLRRQQNQGNGSQPGERRGQAKSES
jgi:hypothetical protein